MLEYLITYSLLGDDGAHRCGFEMRSDAEAHWLQVTARGDVTFAKMVFKSHHQERELVTFWPAALGLVR